MRVRLLICGSCGVEDYFDEPTLRDFIANDCECANCGDIVHQDHGWITAEDQELA